MDAAGLGGRLPLQPPASLSPDARALYARLIEGRLGRAAPFTSQTDAGELIGPFNALLYAPLIGGGFIDFHEAEEHATPLSKRVREIVILSVGAVWASPYETYAHRAVASQVGCSPDVVAASPPVTRAISLATMNGRPSASHSNSRGSGSLAMQPMRRRSRRSAAKAWSP